MMGRKKEKRQSVTDDDRMIDDEPAGSQSMELSVGEVFQNLQAVNSTEIANREKCVSNLRNSEEEHSKENSNDCVVTKFLAKPLKAKPSHFYSESRIEEKKSEKVDVCKMKNLLIFARNMVRENMKELSHCMNMHGKTSMEEKEVEKNNCMHPLSSSISEKRNLETLEEVMNFERLSNLSLGMATAVDRRLKVIAEKLSLVEKDIAGRPPTKPTLSNPSVDNCVRGGVGKEDSEKSNPNAELRSPDKIDASLTKSTKQLQINASELNSSFTDLIEESLNQQECAAPREGPDVSLNMEAEDEIPVMNSKGLNSSFTDVIEERLNEQECVTSRDGSDVSLNVKAEDEVPVMNSKGQGKEDDPKSLPNLEINTSSKRSFPFGNSKKLIPAMKRVKVNSDNCSERIESRYMQSMELSSQNVCSVPSPYRTLKVNLGYRCDSSEFGMELRRWDKNCSYLSKKSINHLKRIKNENGSMNKENCCSVLSVKHQMVKREVEISSQEKYGLMGTFDQVSAEVCSQSVDECLVKKEGSGDHLQLPTKGDLAASKVQRHSVSGLIKAIPSKELTSERLERAVQRMEIKIKEEPVELQEESQMQMDCHSPKKETKCNISSVEEVEVLKIIKPVRVFLGYRCDSKVMFTRDKLVS